MVETGSRDGIPSYSGLPMKRIALVICFTGLSAILWADGIQTGTWVRRDVVTIIVLVAPPPNLALRVILWPAPAASTSIVEVMPSLLALIPGELSQPRRVHSTRTT